MAIASVDGGLLFQVVWSSLLAGVFVTGLFSFVVRLQLPLRRGPAQRPGRDRACSTPRSRSPR